MAQPLNRAVQLSDYGGPEYLRVIGAPIPEAGRGEVRVRVLAASINYTETFIRRHLYPQTAAYKVPFIMGYDVVGEIDQVGPGVTQFKIGDQVADMTVTGSDATYRLLKARDVTLVPADVDPAEAATLILSWTTALQLLNRSAKVRRGERILVHGAAGAVGQALLCLARLAGVACWGAAHSKDAGMIRELGATPIAYDRCDFSQFLPGGFDVVFDGIGEDGYRRSLAALRRGGLLVAIGYSAGAESKSGMIAILATSLGCIFGVGCPAASGPASIRSTRCGRGIPTGSSRISPTYFTYCDRLASGPMLPSESPLIRLQTLTHASRLADLAASS